MRTASAVFLSLCLGSVSLQAQSGMVGVGYSGKTRGLGDRDSDHGPALRVGFDLVAGRWLSWSLEGGLDRFNVVNRQYSDNCFLPGEIIGTCFFKTRDRDVGWSGGTVLRLHPARSALRPYGLVGLGLLHLRQHRKSDAADAAGNPLPNFIFEAAYSTDALQAHLGAGLSIRPAGWPVRGLVEARATRVFYNYSGGLQAGWNPIVLIGVQTGR